MFCPFAHRVNLVRHLLGLQRILPVSVVKPYPKGDEQGWPGWQFAASDSEYPGATVDHLFGSKYLHEVYFKADPDYKGRYSVPVLWDTKLGTIVNNESAEMLRWLPSAFNVVPSTGAEGGRLMSPRGGELDLYPEAMASRIDSLTVWMQRDLNSGVYKAGFAPDQETYDRQVVPVFGALNKLEAVIKESGGPFVLGTRLSELDIRAYATVVRFDPVYVQHFKCNLGMIRKDYPIINAWLRKLYWNVSGFQESTDFRHIKENYTKSHYDINPKAITPMGPWPNVEGSDGVDVDFASSNPGGVMMPAVLAYAETL